MGLGGIMGNIGVALAGKPRRATTPPFIGPTPQQYPSAPQIPDDPNAVNYDDSGEFQSSSPAAQVGSIGKAPVFQGAEDQLQYQLAHPPVAPNTYQKDANGQNVFDENGQPKLMEGSQKIGLGRKIGGQILMNVGGGGGVLGAVGQTLGSRLAYGQYPEQLQQYNANVGNAQASVDSARKTQDRIAAAREEERKIAKDKQEAEDRAAAGIEKDAAQKETAFKNEMTLRQAGAKPYTPAAPVQVQTPSVIPGMPPNTSTGPEEPTPSDVVTTPQGSRLRIPEKERAGMMYLAPAEAQRMGLTGRTVNGEIEVPSAAYDAQVKPDPAAKESEPYWIAMANNPKETPANRAIARAKLADAAKQKHAGANVADQGVTMVGPDGKILRLKPGDVAPGGVMTPQQMGNQNAPTTQMRNVGAQATLVHDETPHMLSEIDRLSAKLGPVAGRWNDFMQGKVGMEDPDFAGLRADLLMYSSAVALMHARGRLPENLRAEFDHAINAPKQTPANLKAVINRIDSWTSQNMRAMGGKGGNQSPASGAAADPLGIR